MGAASWSKQWPEALNSIKTSSGLEAEDFEAAKRKLYLINLLAELTLEEHPLKELYATEAGSA